MTINKPLTSQIDTSDISSTEFASKTQVNSVQNNLSSFASYANSTFSSGGGDVANAWVNANDYSTYTSITANLNSVNSNVDSVAANVYNTYNTLTANIYNTFAYLNANVGGGGGGGDVSNAWVNANDYNTYTTLTANIYNTYDYLQANGTGVTDNLARTLATLALP